MRVLLVLVLNLSIAIQAVFFHFDLTALLLLYILEVPFILIFSLYKAKRVDKVDGAEYGRVSIFLHGIFILLALQSIPYIDSVMPDGTSDYDHVRTLPNLIREVDNFLWIMLSFLVIHLMDFIQFYRDKNTKLLVLDDVLKTHHSRAAIIILTIAGMGGVYSYFERDDQQLIVYLFIALKTAFDLLRVLLDRHYMKRRKLYEESQRELKD